MIEYRPFLNSDPPELVRVWRSQPDRHRFANSFSHSLLESMVLSKPFFDPDGLIVAQGDSHLHGFVHAGFAPREDWMDLEPADGIIAMLLVTPEAEPEVMRELLQRAEQYLVAKGAQRAFVASRFPEGPFYLGLFGGSQIPGVLPNRQPALVEFLKSQGYRELEKIHIYQRRMGDFRAIVDRQQMLVRRNYLIQEELDPQATTWWESCTLGDTDRTRFLLLDRKSGQQQGTVTFWDIHPLSRDWGLQAMGLYDVQIEPEARQTGLATYLIGESVRYLQKYGFSLVEAQVQESNAPAKRLFEKFEFEEVELGLALAKELG